MIYTFVGFMASGKSTIGRLLAGNIGARFIDLDEYIVTSQGKSIADIFSSEGEAAFREIEYNCLKEIASSCYATLAVPRNDEDSGDDGRHCADNQKDLVLSLGGGTFIYEKSRELILNQTKSIYLKTEFEDISRRLSNDHGIRPLAPNAKELFNFRQAIYEQALIIVSTSGKSPSDVANLIASIL